MGRASRILGRILNRLYANPYTTAKLQKVVSEVRQEDHVLAQSLANALDAFEKKTISPEEKLWISRIESLRNELISAGETHNRRSEARRIARTCKLGAMPPLWSLLLFKLVREFRPRKCLELGTSLGFSAAYQAAALEVNHLGSMVTVERNESLAAVARSNLQRLGLSRCVVKIGNFQDVLQEALEDLAPLDFAFLDGDHQESATLSYFEQIVPFLSESALIVFDDISWSQGMARAWKVIAGDQRVKISVDLSKLGACVVTNHLKRKQSFNCELARWERGLAGIASPVACAAGDSA